MKRPLTLTVSLALAILLLMSLRPIIALSATAWSLAYSGRLTSESGKPLAGPVTLEASFWDHATTGVRLGSGFVDLGSVPLTNGVFHVTIELAEGEFHTIFDDPTRIVYIQIRDVGSNKTYPRQRFYAVPYALKVPVDGTSIQFDANGKLKALAAPTDAVSTSSIQNSAVTGAKIAAGAVNVSHMGSSGCLTNQVLQYNGTAWACATIAGTADAGVLTSGTLADNRLSANISKLGSSIDESEVSANSINSTHIKNGQVLRSKIEGCGINQILQYDGTSWQCIATPTNNNASSLSTGSLDDARLSANVSKLGSSIDESEVSANSINSTHIKNGQVLRSKIEGCGINQILQYDGTSWQCIATPTTNNASSLTTGTLDDARLSANVSKLGASIGETEISANAVNSSHIIDGNITTAKIANSAITDTKLAPASVNISHLHSSGCTSNQILKYNGSEWTCAADNAGAGTTDASTLTAGTLSDARLSANVSLLGSSIGSTEIAANAVNTTHIADSNVTASKLAAGAVNANHLNSNGCGSGQILKYNGVNWTCSSDNTGSPTTDASALTSGTLATARLPSSLQNIVNGTYNVGCYSMTTQNSTGAWQTVSQQCPSNYFMSGIGINPTGCDNAGNGCLYVICCHF